MPHRSPDVFPVFDPITEELLYHKPRDLVHTEGDWHRGVQANIVRPNDLGTLDILVQERSAKVDIGPYKFDQSLATQMLASDGLSRERALARGLRDELGVTNYSARRLPLDLRIVKTYPEHPGTLNRELIDLYVVQTPQKKIEATTPKVEQLHWMEWGAFLELFKSQTDRFTKTGRFYFGDPVMLPLIEASSYAEVYGHPDPAPAPAAILQVDRWPDEPRRYQGELGRILMESGEVYGPNQ